MSRGSPVPPRGERPSECSRRWNSRTAAGYGPRDLSGGQKQRVAIARALSGQTAILLADEPTASIDSRLGGQVLDLFARLARDENRAVLIVSHDPKVRAIADRVLQIEDGLLWG